MSYSWLKNADANSIFKQRVNAVYKVKTKF